MGNRGSRFDTGFLPTNFLFSLISREKFVDSSKRPKMAWTVYETDNCEGEADSKTFRSQFVKKQIVHSRLS